MLGVPKIFIPLQSLPNALPGTAQWTSPFPVGSPSYSAISCIWTSSSAAQSYTIHVVQPGDTPVNGNRFFVALAMTANRIDHYIFEDTEILIRAGGSLWAFASAVTSINLLISGWDFP